LEFSLYTTKDHKLIGTFPSTIETHDFKIDEELEEEIFKKFNNKTNSAIGKEFKKMFSTTKETTLTCENILYNPYQLYSGLLRYKFIETKFMADSYQRKKHKKKRINKKWRKMYGFYEVPKKDVYLIENKIIGHPKIIKEINLANG